MDLEIKLPGAVHPITVEPTGRRVTVALAGRVVADSSASLTLSEASYPPVQYVPLADVDPAVLVPSDTTSYCPFKGTATYYGLVGPDGEVVPDAVWTYLEPHDAVRQIAGHAAFYVARVDSLTVSTDAPSDSPTD